MNYADLPQFRTRLQVAGASQAVQDAALDVRLLDLRRRGERNTRPTESGPLVVPASGVLGNDLLPGFGGTRRR